MEAVLIFWLDMLQNSTSYLLLRVFFILNKWKTFFRSVHLWQVQSKFQLMIFTFNALRLLLSHLWSLLQYTFFDLSWEQSDKLAWRLIIAILFNVFLLNLLNNISKYITPSQKTVFLIEAFGPKPKYSRYFLLYVRWFLF